MIATWQHVSAKRLASYLKGAAFCFNRRKIAVYLLILCII
jgi:hypothetical protein